MLPAAPGIFLKQTDVTLGYGLGCGVNLTCQCGLYKPLCLMRGQFPDAHRHLPFRYGYGPVGVLQDGLTACQKDDILPLSNSRSLTNCRALEMYRSAYS